MNFAFTNASTSSKASAESHNPRAQHQHVHIVVLHALVRRISVVAHPRANAGNLVRRHAHAHARPANQNAAWRLAALDRLAHPLRKIGIIVLRLAR